MGRMYTYLVPVPLLLTLCFPARVTAFLTNPQVRFEQTPRAVRRSSSARSPMPQHGESGWRHRVTSTRKAMSTGDTILQKQIRIGGREWITPISGTQASACRTSSMLQAAAAAGSEEGKLESVDDMRSSLKGSAGTAREVEVGPSSTVTFDASKSSEGRKRRTWSPPSRWEKPGAKRAGVDDFGLPTTVTGRIAAAATDGKGPAAAAPSTVGRGSKNAARDVGVAVRSDRLKQSAGGKRSSWNPHSRWSRSKSKSEGRSRSVTKDSVVTALDEAASDVSSVVADIAGNSASTAATAAPTGADGGDAPLSPSTPTTTPEEHNGKKLDEIRATMMASEKAREIAGRLRKQSSGDGEEISSAPTATATPIAAGGGVGGDTDETAGQPGTGLGGSSGTQRIRTAASSVVSIAKNGSGRVVAAVGKRARAATSFAKRASEAGGSVSSSSDTAGSEGSEETAGGALLRRARRARSALAATVKTVGKRVRGTGGSLVSSVSSGGARAWQRVTRVVRGSRDQPQGENRD